MYRETFRLLARIAFWAALLGAYILALLPSNPSIVANDKGNHAIAFVTLAVLARIGWSRGRAWGIAAALVGFGGLIEISQALPIIGRDASWADLAADAIAVAIGMLAGTLILAIARRYFPTMPAEERRERA